MDRSSLQSLLDAFGSLTILVLGDFFLDRYLMIDPAIAETSIETGLEAHQVVEIRNSPGAAGTVTNNLRALGVGNVLALGFTGDDGHGFDLERGLTETGVDTSYLISTPVRMTPTYTKPIQTSTGKEMSRLDVKNRTATPVNLEQQIGDQLRSLYDQVDGIVVLDQVQETDCGVVTSSVRKTLSELASQNDRPILADSRSHIDTFENVILKPNEHELTRLTTDASDPESAASQLANKTQRPVILTRGPDGIVASDGTDNWSVDGIPVSDPIDIVGAGDSVSASVASALAAGAALPDAALLGVLSSSITIQKIGTTGTATPLEILDRLSEVRDGSSSRGQ